MKILRDIGTIIIVIGMGSMALLALAIDDMCSIFNHAMGDIKRLIKKKNK